MSDAHVILAGDSNALGYLNTGPAPYQPTAQVQVWTGTAWNYMLPGTNTGTPNNSTAWGPEVSFANDWLKTHANDGSYLWIVKDSETVKGSTTLAVEWNPNTGAMFASTTHAATAAMHNLDGSPYAFTHYDAALIVLGENDAVNHAYANAYAANLAAFDPAARQAWHTDTLIQTRIEDTMGAAPDNLTVRQAQWNADQADDHLSTFKTIGFSQQPDGIHYDAAGQIAVGDQFFSAWAV